MSNPPESRQSPIGNLKSEIPSLESIEAAHELGRIGGLQLRMAEWTLPLELPGVHIIGDPPGTFAIENARNRTAWPLHLADAILRAHVNDGLDEYVAALERIHEGISSPDAEITGALESEGSINVSLMLRLLGIVCQNLNLLTAATPAELEAIIDRLVEDEFQRLRHTAPAPRRTETETNDCSINVSTAINLLDSFIDLEKPDFARLKNDALTALRTEAEVLKNEASQALKNSGQKIAEYSVKALHGQITPNDFANLVKQEIILLRMEATALAGVEHYRLMQTLKRLAQAAASLALAAL